MEEYKRQHYVPQMLQRKFSSAKKKINILPLDTLVTETKKIKKNAQEEWYYKATDADKTSIEHNYGYIETLTGEVLHKLENQEYGLSTEEVETIFTFAVSQLMRTPKTVNAMGDVLKFAVENNIEEVVAEVETGIRTYENVPMQSSVAIPNVMTHLCGKAFVYLRNNTPEELILSDNPACLFCPAFCRKREDGSYLEMPTEPLFAGYMLYLPISPNDGILFFDDDYYDIDCNEKHVVILSGEDVITLNKLQILNATRLIMYKDNTFDINTYSSVLDYRLSDVFRNMKDAVYTPMSRGNDIKLTGLSYKAL